jgi:hypothetical protein
VSFELATFQSWSWLKLQFVAVGLKNSPACLSAAERRRNKRMQQENATRRRPDQVERGRVSGRDMLEENELVEQRRERKDRSPRIIVGEKQADMSASCSLEDA